MDDGAARPVIVRSDSASSAASSSKSLTSERRGTTRRKESIRTAQHLLAHHAQLEERHSLDVEEGKTPSIDEGAPEPQKEGAGEAIPPSPQPAATGMAILEQGTPAKVRQAGTHVVQAPTIRPGRKSLRAPDESETSQEHRAAAEVARSLNGVESARAWMGGSGSPSARDAAFDESGGIATCASVHDARGDGVRGEAAVAAADWTRGGKASGTTFRTTTALEVPIETSVTGVEGERTGGGGGGPDLGHAKPFRFPLGARHGAVDDVGGRADDRRDYYHQDGAAAQFSRGAGARARGCARGDRVPSARARRLPFSCPGFGAATTTTSQRIRV